MPPEKIPPKKWKAPKGPKPIARKNKNTIGLGRTIQNARAQENSIEYLPDGEMRFTTDKREADWVKLRSVTQENALDEFLNTAELADTDFTAEKGSQVKIIRVDSSTTKNPYLLTKEEEREKHERQKQHIEDLIVPRRPAWDSETTKFQLDRMEKEAFLDWRRHLASLQQNHDLLLTPFERNIEVWRQLWRVIERSDLVVQIVDARNPLLFRSMDLDRYVKELDERKENLLLVNKADMLTVKQRLAWANYFEAHNIKYTFFSAAEANDKLEKEELGQVVHDSTEVDDKVRIITVQELEQLFMDAAPNEPLYQQSANSPPKLQIGLVGYPNVGKSSTINALVGAKKVSVSATPGKTKHFQTILLSDKVILCDCPGLVFPNFAYTNGELVCNGVLPIDQLREYTAPSQLVAQRIPKYYLEAVYGIAIPTKAEEVTSQELLTAYGRARGYMTQGYGSADQSRAARYILKDYVNGKLLFVFPPPDEDGPLTREQCEEFNKDLYTLSTLPENRQEQLIAAAKEKNITEIDLAKDLSKLTFSGHVAATANSSAKTGTNKGGKQAALVDAGDELDKEFFQMNGVSGTYSSPFHKVETTENKKHNKKNKKAQKKVRTFN